MCTGSSARVRPVIAAAAASGSRFSVRGSMSTNTGRARSNRITLALATNENGDVIDLVAVGHAHGAQREVQRGGAGGDGARVAGADPRRERLLERRHPRPQRELARSAAPR